MLDTDTGELVEKSASTSLRSIAIRIWVQPEVSAVAVGNDSLGFYRCLRLPGRFHMPDELVYQDLGRLK
jgi:hypothetical protein